MASKSGTYFQNALEIFAVVDSATRDGALGHPNASTVDDRVERPEGLDGGLYGAIHIVLVGHLQTESKPQ